LFEQLEVYLSKSQGKNTNWKVLLMSSLSFLLPTSPIEDISRKDFDKMFYGNYKFTTELDTGSEISGNQLTVWFAEKVDVKHVDLTQFSIDLLLKALQEPLQSRFCAQLEEERITCQQAFEAQIATLQRPFQATKEQQAKKLPSTAPHN
jgi:hypothetical protein